MSEMPPRHGCAVCGRILDWHEGPDVWVHSLIDLPADHIVVPVPIDELPEQLRPRCDFCLDGIPTHTLPVRSFPMLIDYGSEGDWAACETCAALIEKNQWTALAQRAQESNERRNGPMPAFAQQQLRKLYRELRKNVSGALRRDQ